MPQYKVKPRRNHFQTRNPRTCREIFASKPDASTPHCSHGSVRAFPTQPPTRQKEPVRDNSRIAPTDPRGHMHARAIRQPQRHRLSLRFRQGESPERRSLRSQCRHAGVDGGSVWLDARSQLPRRCARRGHARTCAPAHLRTRALAGSHACGLARLRTRARAGSCARGLVRLRARTLDSSRNVAVEGYVKTRPLTVGICDQAKLTTVFNAAFLHVLRTQHLGKNRTESKLGPINLRRPQARQLSTSARYIVFHCGAHAYPLRFPPWRAHVHTLQIRVDKGSVSAL